MSWGCTHPHLQDVTCTGFLQEAQECLHQLTPSFYKPMVPSLYPCYDKTLYFLVLKIYIILYYHSFTYSMSVCLTLRNRTAINYLPFFTVRIYVSQDHFYSTKPSKWHINRFPPFMSKDFRMNI